MQFSFQCRLIARDNESDFLFSLSEFLSDAKQIRMVKFNLIQY